MTYKDLKGTIIGPGDNVWLNISPEVRMRLYIVRFEDSTVLLRPSGLCIERHGSHPELTETVQVLGAFKGFKTDVVHFYNIELI